MKELDDSKPAGECNAMTGLLLQDLTIFKSCIKIPPVPLPILSRSDTPDQPPEGCQACRVPQALIGVFQCNRTHHLQTCHLLLACSASTKESVRWLLTGEQEEGQVTKYFYRSLYLPSQGMFCELPADLELGSVQVGGLSQCHVRNHASPFLYCWERQVEILEI